MELKHSSLKKLFGIIKVWIYFPIYVLINSSISEKLWSKLSIIFDIGLITIVNSICFKL
jgi:hypothetical protein